MRKTDGKIAWRFGRVQALRAAVWIAVTALLAAGLIFFEIVRRNVGLDETDLALGVTFSKPYAESLGLDWRAAYVATLEDLAPRHLRIPAYWTDLEPRQGQYDFSVLDFQLAEAERHDAKVILAVGRKLPRWPECHAPDWTRRLDEATIQRQVLRQVEAVVRRYADHSAVETWQVENEPFFDFGECPPLDEDFLRREIDLVRSLDDRPIMVTESGELSTWLPAARLADVVGISTYRIVWSKITGYFFWPVTPEVYRRRAATVRALGKSILISELQGEPWTTEPIGQIPPERQLELMGSERLRANVLFARRMGMDSALLWGVEWWYWLDRRGYPEMWQAARDLFARSSAAARAKALGL